MYCTKDVLDSGNTHVRLTRSRVMNEQEVQNRQRVRIISADKNPQNVPRKRVNVRAGIAAPDKAAHAGWHHTRAQRLAAFSVSTSRA